MMGPTAGNAELAAGYKQDNVLEALTLQRNAHEAFYMVACATFLTKHDMSRRRNVRFSITFSVTRLCLTI